MNKCEMQLMIGWTTVPSEEKAKEILQFLLNKKLIACGQIDGPVCSIYEWRNKIEEDTEWRITLKFKSTNQSKIYKCFVEIHPYETPQWVFWEVNSSEEYRNWVCKNTHHSN